MNRIDLTTEQKAEALKLFLKTERVEQLVKEFKKSFKVLDGRAVKEGQDPEYYIIWSSLLNRTIEIPTKELLG